MQTKYFFKLPNGKIFKLKVSHGNNFRIFNELPSQEKELVTLEEVPNKVGFQLKPLMAKSSYHFKKFYVDVKPLDNNFIVTDKDGNNFN